MTDTLDAVPAVPAVLLHLLHAKEAMTELERKAEQVLLSIPTDGDGFGDFMSLFPALAAEHNDHSQFTRRTVPLLTHHAETWFRPWAERIFRAANFGGEDEMVGAVARRSQLEFAYEVYRGTAAESVFDNERDEAADALLATRAVDLGITPTPGTPRTHRWWDWSSSVRVDGVSFPL